MPNVTQTLRSIAGGVSQAAPELRGPSKVSELLDRIPHPARGVHSRPPSRYAATLAGIMEGLDGAHIRELEFSDTERFIVVLTDGTCRLFNADTGAELSVIIPPAVLPYLEEASPQLSAFDVLPVGRDIFVLNRTKVVAQTSKTAGGRSPEALVYIRAGDFATTYTLTVDGVRATYRTPDGDSADQRLYIGTDYIANQLYQSFLTRPGATAFSLAVAGNVIYIRRRDNQDFLIKTTDGLGGEAAVVIKESVETEDDLPTELPDAAEGFVVHVPGPSPSGAGAYWLRRVDGRWKETPQPGVRVELDPSTMPHVLRRGSTVVESLTHAGEPQPPVIETAGSVGIAYGPGYDTEPVQLTTDGQVVESAQIPNFNGTASWTSRFNYSVFAPGAPAGFSATLHFETSPDGSTWTTRGTRAFTGPGEGSEAFALALPSNTRWRVRLTRNEPSYGEFLVFFDSTSELLRISNEQVVTATFAPATHYAGGTQVTLAVGGTPVNYTVSQPSETGAVLATNLAATINTAALPNITASSGGVGVLVVTGDPTAPTLAFSENFNPATTLFDPSAGLVPGALVGRVVEDLADGSTATITANTQTTIAVGAWSGVSSAFAPTRKYRVRYTNAEWSLTPAVWGERLVGNETSAPSPSFVGRAIYGLFSHANRLGITAGDSLAMSSAKSLYQFFRESSRELLDSDPIDVRSRARPGEPFRHAFSWNGEQYLSTERTQFRIDGGPVLTPRSVALSVVSEIPVSRRCAPAVVGTRLYLAAERDGFTQVTELYRAQDGRLVGVPLTEDLPNYLFGAPIRMVGDGSMLLLITEGNGDRSLWSAYLTFDESGRTNAAWGSWSIPSPVSVGIIGGNAAVIARRPYEGFTLELIDLLEDPQQFVCLDAQVAVVGTFNGTTTEWTLPYSTASITILTGGELLVLPATGGVASATGDYSGAATAGISYASAVTLSPLFVRDPRTGIVDKRGRLVVSFVRLTMGTGDTISGTVTRPGRAPVSRTFTPRRREVSVPVLAPAEGTTLRFTSSVFPTSIISVDWEGEFTPRTNRV